MPKSHITGWTPDSPTPAQFAEFFRQCRGPRPRITGRRLQMFLRSGIIFPNEERAREVLGDDIIFPDEVAESRGLSYTGKQLQHFADTMPSEEVLRWCKVNSSAIVAGPHTPMGLLDVLELNPELFQREKGQVQVWYANDDFARNDRAMPEWLAICKELVPYSQLLSPDERVPNAGELSWFITTYYEVRGVRLFKRIIGTSSRSAENHRVILGTFGKFGLCFGHEAGTRLSDVAVARIFPVPQQS